MTSNYHDSEDEDLRRFIEETNKEIEAANDAHDQLADSLKHRLLFWGIRWTIGFGLIWLVTWTTGRFFWLWAVGAIFAVGFLMFILIGSFLLFRQSARVRRKADELLEIELGEEAMSDSDQDLH